jgi:type I restriction enzyme S subunit
MSDVVNQTSKVSKTSEVLDGFKDTELGPLPVDWEVVPMGEIASLTMGQSPPSSTYNTNGQGLPFLQGKAEFREMYPLPVKWCSHPQRVAEPDSILISVRAPVGDVNLAKEKYCIGRGLAAINGDETLDNRFLFYLLIFAKRRLEDEGTGSTFKSINKGVLTSFLIPLPPLPEQRRIAHVLNTIQRQIAAQDALIAAAREVKRSLMQRLFTYGPGPEPAPTKETEIGEMPEHWEVVRLGEVIKKPQYGFTTSASEKEVGPYFLRITDIQDGKVNWAAVPYCKIDKSDFTKYELKAGDIVIARIGATTGKSYRITECPPAVFASYLIRIRTTNRVDSGFLAYFTDSPLYWQQINASKGGRLKQGVNIPVLKSLVLPLPPVSEQGEIAHILTTADRKIAAEEQRQAALQELFKSMLHQLMTGQIRLQTYSDFGSFENFRSLKEEV